MTTLLGLTILFFISIDIYITSESESYNIIPFACVLIDIAAQRHQRIRFVQILLAIMLDEMKLCSVSEIFDLTSPCYQDFLDNSLIFEVQGDSTRQHQPYLDELYM